MDSFVDSMGYAVDTVFGRSKSIEGHPVGPERGMIIDYHGASVPPSKNLHRGINFRGEYGAQEGELQPVARANALS